MFAERGYGIFTAVRASLARPQSTADLSKLRRTAGHNQKLVSAGDDRSRLHLFFSPTGFNEVLFRQHPAENCSAELSKCLFVVACLWHQRKLLVK